MKFLIRWIAILGIVMGSDGYGTVQTGAVEKSLVVILLGPPAAGKGTQASALTEHIALPHISTGDLLRENIRTQAPIGQLAKTYMDEGKLVPDKVVLQMLLDRLKGEDCQKGYILDGFPRTVEQAKALDQHLGSRYQVIVLNLNVSDKELIDRITGRLICRGCSKPYHKIHHPPREAGICDACGKNLYQREDDTEAVFRKRLEVYRAQTAPLIDYYAKKNLLHSVNSSRPQSQVLQEILQELPPSYVLVHSK